MLTAQQLSTIRDRLAHIHKSHVGDLLETSNRLIGMIDPLHRGKFGDIFKSIGPDTAKTISKLGDRLTEEVPALVLAMKKNINEAERDQVLELCKGRLDPTLYLKRLSLFKDSIGRKLRGFGLEFDPKPYRFDLIESLYDVGVRNQTTSIFCQIKNRLDVLVYAELPSTVLDPTKASQAPASSSTALLEANRIVDLRPNFFGIGINLNHLFERFLRRCK